MKSTDKFTDKLQKGSCYLFCYLIKWFLSFLNIKNIVDNKNL